MNDAQAANRQWKEDLLTYFCPKCWSEIESDQTVCPRCASALAEYSQKPYEEKLILALKHPVPENRAVAIQILGELRSVRAVDGLKSILESESDFYILREVLHALAKIDSPQRRAMLSSAMHNPSRLVTKCAVQLLASLSR